MHAQATQRPEGTPAPLTVPHACYVVGLDLGQRRDYTALAVLEVQVFIASALREQLYRTHNWELATGWQAPSALPHDAVALALHDTRNRWPGRPPLALRHLERWRDVPYPEQIARVLQLLGTPPLSTLGAFLVIDATGVGQPLVDMFREAGLTKEEAVAVLIHGGSQVTWPRGAVGAPKRDLVSAVQRVLAEGRLHISTSLAHTDTLVKELENFKVTINPTTAHDSYSAWREADHDDLVLAVALACWWRDRYFQHIDRWRMDSTRGDSHV